MTIPAERDLPMSDHCSLMWRPGLPSQPKELPADCPKGAAYIKMKGGGEMTIMGPGDPEFPIIFEGGDGNDSVTVVGAKKNIIVHGGKGDDSLAVHSLTSWVAGRATPHVVLLLAALAITLAMVTLIAWRALDNRRA